MANQGYDVVVDVDAEVRTIILARAYDTLPSLSPDQRDAEPICKIVTNNRNRVTLVILIFKKIWNSIHQVCDASRLLLIDLDDELFLTSA